MTNFNQIFDTAKKIGKPISLVAFIVALLVYGYVYTMTEQRKMIETASEADRAKLIEAGIRDFTQIDTTGMSEESKYKLIIETIEAREKRFFVTATVGVIVSFFIFLALILVGRSGAEGNSDPKAPPPA